MCMYVRAVFKPANVGLLVLSYHLRVTKLSCTKTPAPASSHPSWLTLRVLEAFRASIDQSHGKPLPARSLNIGGVISEHLLWRRAAHWGRLASSKTCCVALGTTWFPAQGEPGPEPRDMLVGGEENSFKTRALLEHVTIGEMLGYAAQGVAVESDSVPKRSVKRREDKRAATRGCCFLRSRVPTRKHSDEPA